MFSGNDDLISLHGQIQAFERRIKQQERILAELQRLGEPTALAEKFLSRLRDQLAAALRRRDEISQSAANSNS